MSRISLCCNAAKRGNLKPSWMFAKSIAAGLLRPHCPKCGAFEWPRTRRIATLEADNAALRKQLAAAQREAEEANKRLAEVQRNGELAVGDLLIVTRALALQKCQCGKTNESLERCDRCAAMDTTAPDVDAFLARVKREGAAEELKSQAEALLANADSFDRATSIAMRGVALRLLARAEELRRES